MALQNYSGFLNRFSCFQFVNGVHKTWFSDVNIVELNQRFKYLGGNFILETPNSIMQLDHRLTTSMGVYDFYKGDVYNISKQRSLSFTVLTFKSRLK